MSKVLNQLYSISVFVAKLTQDMKLEKYVAYWVPVLHLHNYFTS
jgi:hypothetical protein